MRRAALLALALSALLPAGARAHAALTGTSPERGAALVAVPREVVLAFSEPVEAAFGAVRVFDARGRQVQADRIFRPAGDARRVGVRLPADLPEGGYTVTYRVISADSHPVSGGFVFAHGEGAAPGTSVEELLAGSAAGRVTTTALSVARGIQYAALALAIGVIAFLAAAWLPALRETAGASPEWAAASAAFARRARTLLLVAGIGGTSSAAAGVVLQGAVAAGTSAWAAADAATLAEVVSTRFGTVWSAGLALWLLVLVAVAARPVRVPVLEPASLGADGLAVADTRFALVGVPVALLAALPALGGHAGVQEPVALLLPANVAHVLAMGAWLGGIAVLVLALRHATAALDDGADRARLLAAAVGRFSALAAIAIAALLLTGIVQSIVHVETPENLLDTAFGRAVLIKALLFAGICALGWANRNRSLPGLRRAAADGAPPGRSGVLLRRTLRAELAAGVAVIGVTGALAGYPPSTAAEAGPFSSHGTVGPARAELTVDPARVGANEMHLYLLDRKDGGQYDAAEEVTVEATLPGKGIAPIEMATRKSGPGHYTVTGAAFGVAGDWKVEIGARVGEFDLHTTTIHVPIK